MIAKLWSLFSRRERAQAMVLLIATLTGDYRLPDDYSPSFYTALDPVREFFGKLDFIAYHVDFWRSADRAFTNPETIFL